MEEAPPPAPLRSLARLRRQLALQLGFFTGCRRTAAFLCIGSGILVLIGWWHHITLFKTLHVGTAPMRPLSAIEIILMGCSLLLLGGHSRRVFWKRAGFWMALTFMVFSLFAFGHTLFSWRTPLDPYLLRSSPDRALTNSYVACTIYLLQGTALLLLWFRRFLAAQSLALVSLTTSYFVIIGYLYNLTELQQLPPFHSLSLPFLC